MRHNCWAPTVTRKRKTPRWQQRMQPPHDTGGALAAEQPRPRCGGAASMRAPYTRRCAGRSLPAARAVGPLQSPTQLAAEGPTMGLAWQPTTCPPHRLALPKLCVVAAVAPWPGNPRCYRARLSLHLWKWPPASQRTFPALRPDTPRRGRGPRSPAKPRCAGGRAQHRCAPPGP